MMHYETFFDGLVAGIRSDAPPVILMLYPALLQPINTALVDHTSLEQLRALHIAAAGQVDTPPAVLDVIDAYIALYTALQKI